MEAQNKCFLQEGGLCDDIVDGFHYQRLKDQTLQQVDVWDTTVYFKIWEKSEQCEAEKPSASCPGLQGKTSSITL